MADTPTTTARSIVPVEPQQFRDGSATLRWLSREAYENYAAGFFMDVVDFTEEIVDPYGEELSTSTSMTPAELLGRPLSDYVWVKYTVVMQPKPAVLEAYRRTATSGEIVLEPDEESRRCVDFGAG